MKLKEEIQKLIDLQKIDAKRIQFIRKKDSENPKIEQALNEAFEAEKLKVNLLESELQQIKVKKNAREVDLKVKEEAIQKFQAQLYQLKTNQEYQGKLKEISSAKADISVIEESILMILDELDQTEKKLAVEIKILQEQEKKYKDDLKKIKDENTQFDISIKNLEDKRGILVKDVNPELLLRYEHLLENKHGLALVPLQSGSCGGCFMDLPPEVTNQVKQYKEIIQCGMCARMLYLEEDFHA